MSHCVQPVRLWGLGWIGLIVLITGTVHAATYVATWSGGPSGFYSDPTNWSFDPAIPVPVPPLNDGVDSFEVVIPGGVTVTFDRVAPAEIDQLTVAETGVFILPAASSLSVVSGSSVAGTVQVTGGGAWSSTIDASFAGDEAKILVDGGSATFSATDYDSSGVWRSWDPSGAYGDQSGTWYPVLFRASGPSVLNLASVQSWNCDVISSGNDYNYQTVDVSGGGVLDLSSLQTLTIPRSVRDRLDFDVTGAGSTLHIGSLITVTCAGASRYNDGLRFDLATDVLTVFSSLATIDNVRVNATNGAMASLPVLATSTDSSFVVTTGSQITATDGPIDYSALQIWRSWDASGSYGDQSGSWSPTLMSVVGPGAVLDLSGIASWNSGFASSGNDYTYQTVTVDDGGFLDLGGLAIVTGPQQVRDRLDFNVSGSGSTLDLTALVEVACPSARYNTAVRFDISSDVPVVFSSLVTIDQGTIKASNGASVDLPALSACLDTSFVVDAGSQITANSGSIAFSALDIWRSWDASGSYGDQSGSWFPILMSVTGVGAVLDLSAISTWDSGINPAGNDYTYQTVQVVDGGTLELDGLLSLAGPANVRGRLDFNVSGAGSALDVSSLSEISCGVARYNTAVRFDLSSDVPVDFSALSDLDQGTIKVSNGAVASAPQLTSCADSSFLVSGGATFVADSSDMVYSALQIWRSWDASGSYGDQSGSWNPVLLSVSGAGSLLDLSAMVEWNSDFDSSGNDYTYQTISVTDSGALDLGRLDLLTTPQDVRDRIDVLVADSGSSIDLSSLTEIRCNSSRYNEGVNFDISSDVPLAFGALSVVDRARFRVTNGAALSAPLLTQISDTDFMVHEGSSFVGGPGPVTFSALRIWRDWDASGSYGDQSGSWSPNLMSVSGSGALLDLSGIVAWNSGFSSTGNDTTRQTVTVADGGALLLSGLASIEGPVATRDVLEFFVSGVDSDIDLSSLATISCGSSRYNTATRFHLSGGLPVTLPALDDIDRTSWAVSEAATVQMPSLSTVSDSTVSVAGGASFSAGSGLVAYSTLQTWRSWDASGSYGDQSGTWAPVMLSATDPGSHLDLSSVGSIDAAFASSGNDHTHQTMTVSGGAVLDLSGVTQIELPVSNRDRLDFLADGSGSLLDLSSLQSFVRPGAGQVRVHTSDQALVRLGNVSLIGGEFLTCTDGATVILGDSFFFSNTNEAQVRFDTGRVRFEGAAAQACEVGGADHGPLGSTASNFGFGQLVAGRSDLPTTVALLDATDNGNRISSQAEALYLYGLEGEDGLRVLGGSTVIIDSVNVYAHVSGTMTHLNALFPVGVDVIPFDQGFLQLNQPGATDSLRILYHSPHGPVDSAVDHVDIRFSRPIVPTSFDGTDATMTGPSGSIAVQAPFELGDGFWRIPFSAQMLNGVYGLTIGPDVADLDGGLLDQDGDDTGGEVGQDEYVATFDLLVGLQVTIEQPAPGTMVLPGAPVSFAASSTTGSPAPITYEWSSDLDGVFGTGAALDFAGLTSGLHTITVTATDTVSAEDDSASVSLDIIDPADLSVTWTRMPVVGYAGEELFVSWMVTNSVSTTLTGSWVDAVYVGLGSDLATAVRVGERPRPTGLAAGEAYSSSMSVTIPADWPEGPFWAFIVADADAELVEEDETDNVAVASATLAHVPLIAQLGASSGVESEDYVGETPALLAGTTPIRWSLVEGPTGLTIDAMTGQASWLDPVARLEPYSITIRAENGGGFDDMLWPLTITPSYTAEVAVTPELAPAGTTITFSGEATRFDDQLPAPEVDVKIEIEVQGVRRTLTAQTDSDGLFALDWTPLPTEAGEYDVAAGHPAETLSEAEASFTLIGMRCEPAALARTLTEGGRAVSETVIVRNLGDAPVSGISAEVVATDPSLLVQIDAAPSALGALDGEELSFTVQAVAASPSPAGFTIELADSVGATATLTGTVAIVPATVQLMAEPASLQTGMLRGSQTFVEFEVVNGGSEPSASLDVLIPATPWLSLATSAELPSIAPGERATVVLLLQPAVDLPLGPYAGSVVVNGATTGVSVPFVFTCVSDGVGSLRVHAVDEFTYYGDGSPGVAGASVTVRDAYTDAVVDSGVTDADGSLFIGSLPEAYYRIDVTAPDHGAFQTTLLLPAGEEQTVTAFLPLQLVTYIWSVIPTLIGDAYEIVIDVVFETDVPAPVVTVDPVFVDLQDMEPGDVRQVDYTFSNHGLIAAQSFRLYFQQYPGFTITPLVDDLGDLEAGDERVVPVTIERTSAAAVSGGGGGSQGLYDLLCGGVLVPYSVPWFYGFGTPGTWAPPSPGGSPPSGIYGGPSPSSPPSSGSEGDPWTPGEPFVSYSPIGSILSVLCHPCTRAVWDCFLTHTPIGQIVGTADQALEIAACLDTCISGSFTACLECLRDLALPIVLPEWGDIQSAITCAKSIVACAGSLGLGGSATAAALVDFEVDRLERTVAPWVEFIGDPAWFQASAEELEAFGVWFAEVDARMDPMSAEAERFSASEVSEILALGPPSHLEDAMVVAFAERWNRTVDYWELGIVTVAGVPAGQSTDFIAHDRMIALLEDSNAVLLEYASEGRERIDEALVEAAEDLQASFYEGPGVCARVELRIEQSAVLTRDAFLASLQLINSSDMDAMESVAVTIVVEDSEGVDRTDRFGIPSPLLTGIGDVGGAGSVPASSTASAEWTIIPTSEAAPDAPQVYLVRGILSYSFAGESIDVPLYPVPVTVLPSPSLSVEYFLERDVHGDHPFTPEIEPAVPFSLGLILSNSGGGTARNVRITSAQPEIVDDPSGLLVDFVILGTRVGTALLSPSLTVDLGDVEPGDSRVAQWILEASLQGEFVDYSASFEHLDDLGDPRLSLIESVEIFETEHVVRLEVPSDDGLPDFLTNEIPDVDSLPDRVHSSDGFEYDVFASTTGAFDGVATSGDLEVELTVTPSPGAWGYWRLPNPIDGELRLVSVTRSDGVAIRVSENAWTTHRLVPVPGDTFVAEDRFHLLDFGGTGVYVLQYSVIDTEPPTVDEVTVDPVLTEGQPSTVVTVTYQDDMQLDVSSFDAFDLRITGPDGFDELALFSAVDSARDGAVRTVQYLAAGIGGEPWTIDENGTYSIEIQPGEVFDSAGNPLAAGFLTNFDVAITLPAVTVTSPSSGIVHGLLPLGATATDPEGIDAVRFNVREPGGAFGIAIGWEDIPAVPGGGGWEATFDSTALEDGPYWVVAEAEDAVGNEGQSAPLVIEVSNQVAVFPGDVNGDGSVQISDAVSLVSHLFLGGVAPTCRKAGDVNDDDALDVSDAVTLLTYLFQGGTLVAPDGTVLGMGTSTACQLYSRESVDSLSPGPGCSVPCGLP